MDFGPLACFKELALALAPSESFLALFHCGSWNHWHLDNNGLVNVELVNHSWADSLPIDQVPFTTSLREDARHIAWYNVCLEVMANLVYLCHRNSQRIGKRFSHVNLILQRNCYQHQPKHHNDPPFRGYERQEGARWAKISLT